MHFQFPLGTGFPEEQSDTVGIRICPRRRSVRGVLGPDLSLPGWQGRPHLEWHMGLGSSQAQDGRQVEKTFIGGDLRNQTCESYEGNSEYKDNGLVGFYKVVLCPAKKL